MKTPSVSRYVAPIDGKAGAYGVVFPDLPGCTAMGKTMDEAVANASDALRDWAEVTEESGGKVPKPRSLEILRHDPSIPAFSRRWTKKRAAAASRARPSSKCSPARC